MTGRHSRVTQLLSQTTEALLPSWALSTTAPVSQPSSEAKRLKRPEGSHSHTQAEERVCAQTQARARTDTRTRARTLAQVPRGQAGTPSGQNSNACSLPSERLSLPQEKQLLGLAEGAGPAGLAPVMQPLREGELGSDQDGPQA